MKIRASWLGTFILCAVLYFGVFHGFSDLSIFFNSHALILVFGGTFAVMMLSYPVSLLSDLFDFVVYGFFLKKQNNTVDVVTNLLQVIHHIQTKPDQLEKIHTSHVFIAEGVRLTRNSEMDADDIYDVMNSMKESFYKKYSEDAKVMTNISKFPPALGLLGASTGMISMMTSLGKGGTEAIGGAMAVALTATFWGIAVANFVFLPLADYANRLAEEDLFLRDCITESFVMNREGRSFNIIVEVITGKLPIALRVQVKKLIQSRLNEMKASEESQGKPYSVVSAS